MHIIYIYVCVYGVCVTQRLSGSENASCCHKSTAVLLVTYTQQLKLKIKWY